MPPYVPSLGNVDDTSNFTDIPSRKSAPSIDNFKTKTQFSGKHLPFIGFTYIQTHDSRLNGLAANTLVKDELVEGLKKEVKGLERKVAKSNHALQEKENLEKTLSERNRKIGDLENLRQRLEKDLANTIVQCTVSV